MDDAFKKSLDFEYAGDSELGAYFYQRYLEYKKKYEKAKQE